MVDIYGGRLGTTEYKADKGSGDGTIGAKIIVNFVPNRAKLQTEVDGTGSDWRFDLVQVTREIHPAHGAPVHAAQGNPGFAQRAVPTGQPGAGWGVDMDWMARTDAAYTSIADARKATLANMATGLQHQINLTGDPTGALAADLAVIQQQQNTDRFKYSPRGKSKGLAITSLDPRYAQQRLSEIIPPFTGEGPGTCGGALILTSPYSGNGSASLRDNPSTPPGQPVIGMEFEIGVLFEWGAVGHRQRRYLGSVKWGWTRSAITTSDVVVTPMSLGSHAGVTADFTAAVNHWNTLTVADPLNNQNPVAVIAIPAA